MDISEPRNTQPLKKPIVVVTGASGLIGKRVIDNLADRYQCVGLDKAGNAVYSNTVLTPTFC